MTGQKVIELIGLDRAKSLNLKGNGLSESESIVFDQVRDFGIDSVYCNTDDRGNSFPVVFLKRITSFTEDSLPIITGIHRKIWNYKKVLFLYIYSDTEIRIYNCSEKPLVITKDFDYNTGLKKIEIATYTFSDKNHLQELNMLFSRIALDTGIVWTSNEGKFIRDKINLKRRVDKYLVESLVNTAIQLEQQGLDINLINKIILRSLFLLYLEDRGATDEDLYSHIKKDAKSYLDILCDKDATYQLYKRLEEDFNGNVFTVEKEENISSEQLLLIRECFICGNDKTPQKRLFDNWRLFDFSIIQIELLSEIYENFLFKTDPELKKQTGAYYTPPALVEFILNEKLPVDKSSTNYNIKILDPSCGSGIFLVEGYNRLVKRYENQHNEKLTDFDKLSKLLTDNIFGIEIHQQAIKVAAFSLYLALVDKLDPKNIWQKKKYRLPNLINNPQDKTLKGQGNNLFCRDAILQNEEIEHLEFDLVVGNPPFGTTDLQKSISDYCDENGFAKEKVLPFLHKATKFAPKGEVALIFNTKILTNTLSTYKKFRYWLFNKCYVEKVYNFSILRKADKNFGGQLFSDATGPISIVFYQKEAPMITSNKIGYYAPKTFIKSNVIDGLTIDFSDLKYIPREECKKSDSKIWKIAMWGGMNDWELIQRLDKEYSPIKKYFKEENIDYGVGFELSKPADKPNQEIRKLPIHTPKNILRYYTATPSKRIESDKFRRLGKEEAYQTSHILLNEGIKVENDKLTVLASYVDYKSAYSKGIVGIYSKNDDINLLKILTVYLNSDFIRYYSFLATSSWGIERDVVKHKELFEAPFLFEHLNENQKKHIVAIFDEKFYSQDFFSSRGREFIENELNELVFNFLSKNDRYIIQNLLNNIDLFHKQEKSISQHPVLLEHAVEYAKIICTELNDFFDGQDLYTNATIYDISRFTPLMLIKLSFAEKQEDVVTSREHIDEELKRIDQHLWEERSSNIYFRKKLNYKTGNDIFIIRPNHQRFWSQSMALEDASELILEILKGD